MIPIIQRLNAHLDSDTTAPDTLRELIEEFNAKVSPINAKLSMAVDFVNRGLRSEAIAIVAGPPSLLDAATRLEFPRAAEMAELISLCDLLQIIEIDSGAIAVLNDAMVELQSIDGLLRRHRQLALARAPLAWRLRTLRAIAAADPTSFHWQEDITLYEKVRLSQLASDVKHAIDASDLDELKTLREELASPSWITKPSPRLLSAITTKFNEVSLSASLSELSAQAIALNAAYEAFDESAGREAAKAYQSCFDNIVKTHGAAAVPSDATTFAAESLEWIREIDAEADRERMYADAIYRLDELTKNSRATVPQLESAYQKAASFGQPVPPELFNRLRVTVEDLRTRGRRKFTVVMASVVAATLFAIVSVGAIQMSRSHAARVANVAAQLNSMLDSEQLAEASKFIDTLEKQQTKLASEPTVTKAIARHATMVQTESTRAERFNQALLAMEALSAEELDVNELNRLETEAKTDDEILRMTQQKQRQQNYLATRTQQQTESLTAALRPLRNQLSTLSKAATEVQQMIDMDRITNDLNSLIDSFNDEKRNHPFASRSLLSDIDTQIRRIEAVRSRLLTGRGRVELAMEQQERILAARNAESLRLRLESFVAEVAEHPDAAQYQKSLDAAEFWPNAQQWNQCLTTLRNAHAEGLEADACKQALELHNEVIQKNAAMPFTLPGAVGDALKNVDARQKKLFEIEQFFKASLFSQLLSVTGKKDGVEVRYFIYRRFYDQSRKSFELKGSPKASTKLEVVGSGDGAIIDVRPEGDLLVDAEPAESIAMLLAKMTSVKSEAVKDWDGAMIKCIMALRDRPNLDSNLREVLSFQLIKRAADVSPSSNLLLDVYNRSANRDSLWKDWFRPTARTVSVSDLLLLETYPRLKMIYDKRPNTDAAFASLSKLRLEPVGMILPTRTEKLNRGANDAIHWWTSPKNLISGKLYTIRRDAQKPDAARWFLWGKLHDGTIQSSEGAKDETGGQVVFFCQS